MNAIVHYNFDKFVYILRKGKRELISSQIAYACIISSMNRLIYHHFLCIPRTTVSAMWRLILGLAQESEEAQTRGGTILISHKLP